VAPIHSYIVTQAVFHARSRTKLRPWMVRQAQQHACCNSRMTAFASEALSGS
jgi:hypothetical protein